MFAFQWVLGIVFAIWASPLTWAGDEARIHLHVYASIIVGGILALYPIYLTLTHPGRRSNRYVVAVAQISFSTLFIHLTGGRIETHFHVFGSLAFLAFYRDWKPVVLATAITALDHLFRGMFWPESVYGVLNATPWRALEHSAWVIFEDFFLFISMRSGIQMLWNVADKQSRLELTLANVENLIQERTAELLVSQQTVTDQQQALASSSKMSALGEMAGGVAHEINNPLAIIRNLMGQLQEVVDDHPIDKALIKSMAANAEFTVMRIAKIIKGLKSFSRDGRSDPFEAVNLSQLIEETLSFCSERFKIHETDLNVDDFSKSLCFDGRATEVSQVLLNLLNNAFDATFEFEKRWIRVSASDEKDWLEIKVTDCGPGIPTEIQEKIFQPFFSTKEIGKGIGMGLSLSSGIVQKHRGELKLDLNCRNTCFVVRLPKKQNSA